MSLYQINEGTVELPENWTDRTMNIFTPDNSENPEWNIVVSRDQLNQGDSLQSYLDEQLEQMPKALPRFRLQSNEETTVDGFPAREIVSTWVGENGTVRQKQIVLVRNNKSLVFTFTVLERLHHKHEEVLSNFVSSFVLRRD